MICKALRHDYSAGGQAVQICKHRLLFHYNILILLGRGFLQKDLVCHTQYDMVCFYRPQCACNRVRLLRSLIGLNNLIDQISIDHPKRRF